MMHVLTNPHFVANGLIVHLALSTSDERFRVSFSVETGHQQRFMLWLDERADPYPYVNTTKIWSVEDERTYEENRWPEEQLHEGLRSFIASNLPELMLRGFILEGSYEYDGRVWDANQAEPECFDLPELGPVA